MEAKGGVLEHRRMVTTERNGGTSRWNAAADVDGGTEFALRERGKMLCFWREGERECARALMIVRVELGFAGKIRKIIGLGI